MANQPSLRSDTKTRWRVTLAPWAQEVVERTQELRDLLEHVDPAHRDRLSELLDLVDVLAYEKVPIWRWTTRLADWWYGSRVERAWSYVHQAELMFVEYADDRGLEIARDYAMGYALTLASDDPVRVRFEAYVQSLVEAHPNGDRAVPGPSSVPAVKPPTTSAPAPISEPAS
jgi:hypothetical protein